jgi:hypothetical protein
MANLDHMPDFASPLTAGESVFFPCFGTEEFSIIPAALGLAHEATGRPAFQLQMVRRSDDLRADGQYALIDVHLAGDYALDTCLAAARAARPDAIVRPATINRGFARLIAGGTGVQLPPDLTEPTELGWSTADGARWTHKLDVSSGELIKGALKSGALLFSARAEFTVLGIAPRMPARVTFEPAALLDAALRGTANRQIDAAALHAFLSRPVEALPLQIVPSGDTSRLPQILLDRLFAAYGALAPAPDAASGPMIAFSAPPSGQVIWDLAQPCVVPRAFALQFDLLTALKDIGDTSALIHETIIPPLDLGFHDIVVVANLPIHRSGVPAIGVRIDIAPNPPHRPSGITETLVFEAPDDQQKVSVSLSPGEALKYDMVCFAILAAGQMVQQIETQPKSVSAQWLQLQTDDFPLQFVHITASDRLIALATIDGALTYLHGGKSISQPIRLDREAADIALAYPADASDVAITVDATALDASKSLPVPGLSAGRILLDLTSFPDYGPHRIPVTCDFKSGDGMLSVDLVGEDGGNPATVTLVPAMPASAWGYVAQSPFHAGYRYRLQDGDWTDVAATNAPLALTVN